MTNDKKKKKMDFAQEGFNDQENDSNFTFLLLVF